MQVINTNVMSLNAQRTLDKSQMSMQTSLERLSSGLRINSAKDDAAGLAISERFTSQIRGLNQAIRNANDGISLLQTAEGALGEVADMLQRMRELAVQSSNGTYNGSDRNSLQDEFRALQQEISRIGSVTEFNSIGLMNSAADVSLQVGWENGANNVITVDIKLLSAGNGAGGISFAVANTLSIGSNASAAGARDAIGSIDSAIDNISNLRATLVLSRTVSNLRFATWRTWSRTRARPAARCWTPTSPVRPLT